MFVNGRPALRVSDNGIHAACCGPNTWVAKTGSATVFIENLAAHRMFDTTSHCGGIGKLVEGSSNVIVGGNTQASGSPRDGTRGVWSTPPPGNTTGGAGPTGGGDGGDGGGGGEPQPTAAPPEPPPRTDVDQDQIEVQLVNALNVPQAGVSYDLRLPDGSTRSGTTGNDGFLRYSMLTVHGTATLILPAHDSELGAPDPARTAGATRYHAGGVEAAIGARTVVELAPRIYRGRLTGVLFDTERAFVLPGGIVGIRLIKRMYDDHPASHLLITGHADQAGQPAYNRTLSQERAEAMAAFLKDDADAWLKHYRGTAGSHAWGTREDQYMLQETGYGPAVASDLQTAEATASIKAFQADAGLPVDGFAGDQTRRALIAKYMSADETSLPAGTTVVTHGCGESHPAEDVGDGNADQANRRVEVFVFEALIDPPPVTPCPLPNGCSEYAQWVQRTVQTLDLSNKPGTVVVRALDPDDKPVAGASVHLSGPTAGDGTTSADGSATVDDLAPGHYIALGTHEDFDDATCDVEVTAGETANVELHLMPPIDWNLFTLGVQPLSDEEVDA